jgi:hypothetical protein
VQEDISQNPGKSGLGQQTTRPLQQHGKWAFSDTFATMNIQTLIFNIQIPLIIALLCYLTVACQLS